MAFPMLLLAAVFDLAGNVVSFSGQPAAETAVALQTLGGQVVQGTRTNSLGEFRLAGVRPGQYQLVAEGTAVAVLVPTEAKVQVVLGRRTDSITVTAEAGRVTTADSTAAAANSLSRQQMAQGAYGTMAQQLAGTPGILVQQTSTAQASPFLRGLTGYQVVNLVDSVRINNSTYRSGPNQYLALLDASQAARLETVLGPNSVAFGSDALGGTIQMVSRGYDAGPGDGKLRGEVAVFGAQADLSAGVDAALQANWGRVSLRGGATARRHQDLRAGAGTDSRHALRRFLGLTPGQITAITGERQQDSGFDQSNTHAGADVRLTGQDVLRFWLQTGDQWRIRNTKDLWGGLGRQISTLEPQQMRLAYLRWDSLGRLGLDTFSVTGSANLLRDGSRRQALLATNTVTTDRVAVDTLGLQALGTKRWNRLVDVSFGGELYRDAISAARTDLDPVRNTLRESRPLYPDDSRYTTSALFLQNQAQLFSQRLTLTGGLRYTQAGLTTRANPFGTREATQRFPDLSYQGSASWRVAEPLQLFALFRRGFRAPNSNDLGAIGLNDLGYEIPAREAVEAGALQGATAGEDAVPIGRSMANLRPETLRNYESGFRLQTRRLRLRGQAFWNDLYDPIVRRTVLFAAGQAPATLAGLGLRVLPPTAAQAARGVVTVATPLDSRAIKAFVNDGQARYYGTEVQGEWQMASRWTFHAGYSYILGRDLNPNRNIRRLPPQQGSAGLRYTRPRWWTEVNAMLAGAQRRLSGGDLDDERIGASRSVNDIAAFFASSRLSPYVRNGLFVPTGESLAQIQARVLPGVTSASARVPMYRSTAGWVSLQWLGGLRLGETWNLQGGVTNVLDQNYRVHGSGMDAGGRNVFLRLQYRF